MRTLLSLFALALIALRPLAPAQAAPACPAVPAPQALPREAEPEFLPDPAWRARVADLDRTLAATDLASVRLLFLGDSLVETWTPELFRQFYGSRGALNLGVRGDSTQGLLWRLARSPLGARLHPRAVVLLIGTNDLWPGVRAEDVAQGIVQVVRLIHQRSPDSRIVLVGLLPRGADAADPLRAVASAVNRIIARCADGNSIIYAEPGRLLVDGEGHLSDVVSSDRLHLTWVGYGILSAALEPAVRQALGD